MTEEQLSPREQVILEAIVRNYISSAEPTGSRFLSKQTELDLSPASIRNIMGDLEEKGFINQPHTSAGRVPTDKGYRYYVDCMMKTVELAEETKITINSMIQVSDATDLHLVMEATSKALSRVSNQLGVILAPRLATGNFRHIHIFEMEPHRYLLHLTVDSGFVKTMAISLATDVSATRLETACRIINDRFFGKRMHDLVEIGETVFDDVGDFDLGVIRMFVPSIKRLLQEEESGEIITEGETNIMLKPDFAQSNSMGAIIEILNEKKMLMHLIDTSESAEGKVIVSIGGENKNGIFESFSVLKTKYHLGNLEGSLGIVGPKRMPYPLLVSAVDYTAKLLSTLPEKEPVT
jgi:heat-inducible transcriptional repressor